MYLLSFHNPARHDTVPRLLSALSIAGLLLFSTAPTFVLAEASSTASSSDQTVETGDANSNTSLSNDANNNVLSLTATSTGDSASSTHEDSTSEEGTSSSDESLSDATSTLVDGDTQFSNTNDLGATTTSTTTAGTGENLIAAESTPTASSTLSATSTGTSTIQTGDASSYLNILNNVNNTLLNATGTLALIAGGDVLHNIDIDPDETNISQQLSELTLQNMNNAKITNKAVVIADTGGNKACREGNTSIKTGDARAGANVVNFANNTFIDSKYAVVSANVLGNFLGSLILPGKSFFQKVGDLITQGLHTHIANSGNATTTAGATTQTGQNSAMGDVQTGASVSTAQVGNVGGMFGIGGAPFVNLNFNIGGNWNGKIYSLPNGITYTKTDTGFTLSNEPTVAASGTKKTTFASSTIESTSTADITNDISVLAKTGENVACGDEASITTGNAIASLTVLNLFNMTFYGKNFLYGAVNVIGDWKGNVSFGQPDLAVLGSADVDVTKRGAYPGSTITFHYTIANNGGADATNVIFTDAPGKYLSVANKGDGSFGGDGTLSWQIPKIVVGGSVTVSYTVNVDGSIPYGTTYVENHAEATEYEPDANTSDNTEVVSVPLYRAHPHHHGGNGNSGSQDKQENATSTSPLIHITKTNDAVGRVEAGAGTGVNYTIVIDNDGGPAYDSILFDALRDSSGDVISKQSWNLDTIKAGEEIKITYTILYNENTLPGRYANSAYVSYRSGTTTSTLISPAAVSSVVVENPGMLGQMESEDTIPVVSRTSVHRNDSGIHPATTTPLLTSGNDDTPSDPSGIFGNTAAAANSGFDPEWLLYLALVLLLPLLYLISRYRQENRG